jgi:hypothetical protein
MRLPRFCLARAPSVLRRPLWEGIEESHQATSPVLWTPPYKGAELPPEKGRGKSPRASRQISTYK